MISFFAKEPYIKVKPSGTTVQRVSSIIRAHQIAEYLGGRVNPKEGFENDVCIHLKPYKLDLVRNRDYVDILDDHKTTEFMRSRPEPRILALTTQHRDWLSSFLPNEIILLPQQHVNHERRRRTRTEITTCGYIGANQPSQRYAAEKIGWFLEKAGIKFISLFSFQTREDILRFYDSIDIQVIGNFGFMSDSPYYTPKKIIDAMSFGIPTVADPKLGYGDIDGFYNKATSMVELVSGVKKLQAGWDAERLINKAEEYHISRIAELYKKL